MPTESVLLLSAGIFLVAVLYSSVGHAGASGYVALMSLLSLSPEVIKPTALSLNILVATIATWHFLRSGHFSWRLFWPFAALAVPFAFVGGHVALPIPIFKVLVGVVLLGSAAGLLLRSRVQRKCTEPPVAPAVAAGAAIGLLSGLTGTGGGIFLTPLLLQMRWAQPKAAAAVSAPFILLNSVAALAGNIASTRELPAFVVPLLLAASAGGFIGSYLGSQHFPPVVIKRFLAAVLLIAGGKLIFT